MVDRTTLPYRDCVGIAVFNREGKVFIGRRRGQDQEQSAEHGSPWQMPQGGMDAGEGPEETARRELYEETSVRSIEPLTEIPDWIAYDIPGDVVGTAWKGKYRGQRQRWLAFLFTGDESEIDVLAPGGGKHKPEFDRWRWEDLARLPELIVPFKRRAYEQVCAGFADLPPKIRESGGAGASGKRW
jgi:putative (di)nucleoside polyphosphate hydrolase